MFACEDGLLSLDFGRRRGVISNIFNAQFDTKLRMSCSGQESLFSTGSDFLDSVSYLLVYSCQNYISIRIEEWFLRSVKAHIRKSSAGLRHESHWALRHTCHLVTNCESNNTHGSNKCLIVSQLLMIHYFIFDFIYGFFPKLPLLWEELGHVDLSKCVE